MRPIVTCVSLMLFSCASSHLRVTPELPTGVVGQLSVVGDTELVSRVGTYVGVELDGASACWVLCSKTYKPSASGVGRFDGVVIADFSNNPSVLRRRRLGASEAVRPGDILLVSLGEGLSSAVPDELPKRAGVSFSSMSSGCNINGNSRVAGEMVVMCKADSPAKLAAQVDRGILNLEEYILRKCPVSISYRGTDMRAVFSDWTKAGEVVCVDPVLWLLMFTGFQVHI